MINRDLEQLYQDVELVRGSGERQRMKLCVMSFAALLAGDVHTDKPAAVSPLIRNFAVIVNDDMPPSWRQLLKPFAIRLVGTNDRLDMARVALLFDIFQQEVLPRVLKDFPARPRNRVHQLLGLNAIVYGDVVITVALQILKPYRQPSSRKEGLAFATNVAKLLTVCGNYRGQSEHVWYWTKAIDILDQLGTLRDLGDDAQVAPAPHNSLQKILPQSAQSEQMYSRVAGALSRALPFFTELPF